MLFAVMIGISQEKKDFYLGPVTRVLLVIDGVDMLLGEGKDDRRADLSWLPE